MFKLALLLLPVIVLAQDAKPNPKEVAEAFFKGIDADEDGEITRADIDTYFDTKYDNDTDLEITADEFKAYVLAQRPDLADYVDAAYGVFDQNGDGQLDDDDFTPAFLAADVNDDDLVDEAEFLAVFVPLFEKLANGDNGNPGNATLSS